MLKTTILSIITYIMKRMDKKCIPIFNLGISRNNSCFANEQSVNIILTPITNAEEMDEIIGGLWLGGLLPIQTLLNHNFTHILSIIDKEPEYLHCPCIKTKWVNISDNSHCNISQYFDECNTFINDSLASGGKIYVHCQMGFSRSPSIVIAYLMKHDDKLKNFNNAFDYVRSKRPNICPNLGFLFELQQYLRS
jgi:hypothetical protein